MLVYCFFTTGAAFGSGLMNAEILTCSLPFSVHELDRNSLELKNKYSFSKTVFGLPTVAVPVNEKIYMGSFHSDRIGYFIKE